MDDIAKIAAGLSEAQRDAIMFWPRGHWGGCTSKSLYRRKLVKSGFLSDLGLAVRDHLRSKNDG